MSNKIKYPFGAITITEEAKQLIAEALNSGRVSQGKYVQQLERKFAELIGVDHAVAVSSGTDADALALACLYDLGAKREDEIIVPALSFVATAGAVLQAGFKPVFVDVARDTLNIDPEKIEAVISKKTRAIMPVHLMGKPVDMEAINRIAKQHQLYVIEDAAEAHGALYKNKKVGSLGDLACFSLYVAHILTTVEGGMVVTNRGDLADILRSLRSHGRSCKCPQCVLNINSDSCSKRFQSPDGEDIRFIFERVGFSAKMNELEAAIGLGSLGVYDQILTKRRHNLYYLIDQFQRFKPQLLTIKKEDYEEIGPHALPITVQEGAGFSRNQLVTHLEKKGIDSRSLFQSIPTQCAGFKFLGYQLGDFPNAEYIGKNGIHVGVHQDLDQQELDYLLNVTADLIQSH